MTIQALQQALTEAIKALECSGYAHDHPQLERFRAALATVSDASPARLPPLPAPKGTMQMNWGTPSEYDVDGYTAAQMRGYAIDATFAIQSNDGRLDAAIATQSKEPKGSTND